MLLIRVLNMSLTASYCILAVLAARLLLYRAPKKYAYLLWLVVAFRLCCPVSLTSPVSLFNLAFFDQEVASGHTMAYLDDDVAMQQNPELATGVTMSSWQSAEGSHGNGAAVNSAQPQGDQTAPALHIPLPAPEDASNSVNPLQIWGAVGTLLWLTGMSVLLLYGLLSYLLLGRRLRRAVLLRENIYQSEQVVSPFILGFLRPRIYIPYGLEEQMLELVLAHERYHLRRRDHWVKLFGYLLLSLHWFNPLCWVAFLLMGRDMEMSCDEYVLARRQHSCKPYCNALLAFAVNRRSLGPSPLAFGESGAKGRIRNALNWKKPGIWVKAAGVCLCLLTIAVCGLNPRAESPDPKEDIFGGSPGDMAADIPEQESNEESNERESEGIILRMPHIVTDHTWYGEVLEEARAGQRVLETTGIDFYGAEQILLELSWECEELPVHVECYDIMGKDAVLAWQRDNVLYQENESFRINIVGDSGIYEKLSGDSQEIRIYFSHEEINYLVQGLVSLQGKEQEELDAADSGSPQHFQGLIRSVTDRSVVIDKKKMLREGDSEWEEWAAQWDPEGISGGMALVDAAYRDLRATASPDCRITILENHWQPQREISWDELLQYMEDCPWHLLWNFTVEGGLITEIEEQYLP